MKSQVAMGLLLVACRHPAPATNDAAPAVVTTTTTTTTTASAAAPDPTLAARLVLKKWNDAHNAHDSGALEALYAKTVHFYGQDLSGTECAKRKAAAFAKSPDYSQTVQRTSFRPQGDGYLVRFMKTSRSHGKATDYPAFLVISKDRVTEESDKITDENLAAAQAKDDHWCLGADLAPNDVVRAPFTISASKAWGAVWSTKHVKATQAKYPELGIDAPLGCPTPCGADPESCGLAFRVVNMANIGVSTSILVEWLYVDAVKKVMWYPTYPADGGMGWTSEPLE